MNEKPDTAVRVLNRYDSHMAFGCRCPASAMKATAKEFGLCWQTVKLLNLRRMKRDRTRTSHA